MVTHRCAHAAGQFREEVFEKRYGFINELKDNELAKLEKQIAKTKKKREKEKLQAGTLWC